MGREVALERVGVPQSQRIYSERMTGAVDTEPLRVKGGLSSQCEP